MIVGVGPVDALRALRPPLGLARLGLLQLLLRLLQLLRVGDHGRRLLLLHVLSAAAVAAVGGGLGPRRRRQHRLAGFVAARRGCAGGCGAPQLLVLRLADVARQNAGEDDAKAVYHASDGDAEPDRLDVVHYKVFDQAIASLEFREHTVSGSEEESPHPYYMT